MLESPKNKLYYFLQYWSKKYSTVPVNVRDGILIRI